MVGREGSTCSSSRGLRHSSPPSISGGLRKRHRPPPREVPEGAELESRLRMGATAVEEEFLRQSEWAARARKAPTGPEGKGELETRGKWPKSRVSARKGGFGPEEWGAT